MNIKKYGSWNCIPQEIEILICFSNAKNTPSIRKEVIIPNTVIKKLLFIFLSSVLITDNNFNDNTGNTHGIRFKINPPNSEIKSKYIRLSFIEIFLSTFSISTFFSTLKL